MGIITQALPAGIIALLMGIITKMSADADSISEERYPSIKIEQAYVRMPKRKSE